jgi:glucose-6-phosphate isomerase
METLKKRLFWHERGSNISLNTSRMDFAAVDYRALSEKFEEAFSAMEELEAGSMANPDEGRMVGHYWLRDAERAPEKTITDAITRSVEEIKGFVARVHSGELRSGAGKQFRKVLLIGIGGSALGPQLVYDAMRSSSDKMSCHFFDNTDADGMCRELEAMGDLGECLCIVVSKSGNTKETRNGLLIAQAAFQKEGIDFSKSAVAVTGEGSRLYHQAQSEKWRSIFPMWDWVGGRTSVMSAVGLLPAALQGVGIDDLLSGAGHMDSVTRKERRVLSNPAAMLAASWFLAGDGKGKRDMVILPYSDRLLLFSRYLQQLVMESLGKEKDLQGNVVHQGINVFGNKGSTDQHAYVQQLRDGVDNFFVTFIEVLKDTSEGASQSLAPELCAIEVEPEVTAGDYLHGFCQGTREALSEKGRKSLSLTLPVLNEFTLGALIALFERAVGYYATLVGINAYHQPGVEAGKRAAGEVLELQRRLLNFFGGQSEPVSLGEVATALDLDENDERLFSLLRHLSANDRLQITEGESVFDDQYSLSSADDN